MCRLMYNIADLEDTVKRLKRRIKEEEKDRVQWESLLGYVTDIRDLADCIEEDIEKGIPYL